jgi:hypothetical protein
MLAPSPSQRRQKDEQAAEKLPGPDGDPERLRRRRAAVRVPWSRWRWSWADGDAEWDVRLYLINSPVVRAEPLRFKEEGVRAVIKDVFLPWFNAYRFFVQNAKRMEQARPSPAYPRPTTLHALTRPLRAQETGRAFVYAPSEVIHSGNVMDQWVLASTQSLVQFVIDEMKGMPPLLARPQSSAALTGALGGQPTACTPWCRAWWPL